MKARQGALIALVALSACQSPKPQDAPKQVASKPNESPVATPSETVAPPPATQLSVEQAREMLKNATKTFAKDPATWLELALFEFKANNPAEGERLLKEIQQRFPTYARAPYHLAMRYLAERRTLDAALALDAAARLAPNDPDILNKAGVAYLGLGDEARAKAYGERAAKADPRYAEAYILLARVNDRPGTADKAIEYANQYVKYAAEPSAGYYMLGRTYARQANKDKAIEALLKAREAAPDNPKIWLLIGRVYYELFRATKEEEGLQCLQKALELDPNSGEAHEWLGRIYSGRSNWTEAVAHFQKALSLSPDPGSLYYDLGQALMKSGNIIEGQKLLQRHKDFQDYSRLMQQLTAASAKEPKNRALRYDMIRLCLKYHQAHGAMTLLSEAERLLGTDATFQALRQQASAEMNRTVAPNSPNPSVPLGGVNER